MKVFSRLNLWRGLAAVFVFLTAVCICASVLAFENSGQINSFLNITASSEIIGEEGDTYYKSAYTEDGKPSDEGVARLKTAADEFTQRQMEEGAVLVVNRESDGVSALPLAADERSVTFFGRAAADPIYKNKSGGPLIQGDRMVSLLRAFEEKGFEINDTVFDALAASDVSRVGASSDAGSTAKSDIGEVPADFYDQYASSWANDYNDVAIVVFSRYGGEGTDMQKEDADGVSQLSLHSDEGDLLKMIKASGKFSKTVVLINSGNAMDLSWAADYDTYGVDACLWIGGPGLSGFRGVPTLLTGEANPSGHFTDTYATSQLSSPAVVNAGSFTWSNLDYVSSQSGGNSGMAAYIVEQEGIYVGYKYYESRYNDYILGQYNADSAVGRTVSYNEGNDSVPKTLYTGNEGWNYAKEMAFPFGYGLSYTTFEQEFVDADGNPTDEVSYDPETDEFTFRVKVTNTGSRPGKSVVQLYVQAPYTEYDRANLVEKSAVQLVGFAKTGELAADGDGASETVEITVDRYLLASYDGNGAGGYILDGGDYYFGIGSDAHDALNNILARRIEHENITNHRPLVALEYDKGKTTSTTGIETSADADKALVFGIGTAGEIDADSYAYSDYTGAEVTNAFVGADAVDINNWIPGAVTYLTRGGGGKDWASTYPTAPVSLTATDDMIKYLRGDYYEIPSGAPSVDSFEVGVDYGLNMFDMRDVPLTGTGENGENYAETWERFVSQMSLSELAVIVDENYGQKEVISVSKPINNNNDGPDGIKTTYSYGPRGEYCTCYVNELVTACTWSKDIMAELGAFLAEDALYTRTTQLWCPGLNLHRTPLSGRNFEYYSEDSVYTYICGAVQVSAMQQGGLTAAVKHFAANDQDCNRQGLATFSTEQRLRQESLKGFEGAFTVGGALGTMTAYNRYGCIQSAQSNAAQNVVLRGEWGFCGVTITDASISTLMHTRESLTGGTDTFNADSRSSEIISAIRNGDGNLLGALREANKHFYYALVRTSNINGMTSESQVSGFVPWWQSALIALDVILGLLAAGGIVMYVLGRYVFGRRTEAEV